MQAMWSVYRKLLVPSQLFILVASVTAYFAAGRDWIPPVIVFVVMQIGAIAGAASVHARSKKPIRRRGERLPLQRP